MNIAKFLRMHILKNTCQWLLLYEDAKTLEKYFVLGIWMFLRNLFEPEYIWIFSVFKMGIFIEKKSFALRIQFSEAVVRRCSSKIDRCSWKFRKFLRQTVTSESLINKVAGLQAFRPAVSFKKRLRHRCFSVKLGKFFQHLFIQWHSRWLLLSFNRFYSSTRLSDSAWRSGQVII